jgi:hypothetical protein
VVIEALTERLVGDSERALAPIMEDPEMGALEKLQGFCSEIIRWKSARQNLLAAMLTIWYAPDNIAFRLLVDRATAKRLAPLLSAIVRQGVDEHRFATAYSEQAGAIIVAVLQALQDAMAHQLLAAARRSSATPKVKEIAATHAAHIEAIERYLGCASRRVVSSRRPRGKQLDRSITTRRYCGGGRSAVTSDFANKTRKPMDKWKTTCLVVGGGPAGMMLSYLLARSGVQTLLLEKHGDFFRDFRGDTVHPSTTQLMHELGILEEFLRQVPHQAMEQLGIGFNGQTFDLVDFRHLPTACKYVVFMPQWDFLNFLADKAAVTRPSSSR